MDGSLWDYDFTAPLPFEAESFSDGSLFGGPSVHYDEDPIGTHYSLDSTVPFFHEKLDHEPQIRAHSQGDLEGHKAKKTEQPAAKLWDHASQYQFDDPSHVLEGNAPADFNGPEHYPEPREPLMMVKQELLRRDSKRPRATGPFKPQNNSSRIITPPELSDAAVPKSGDFGVYSSPGLGVYADLTKIPSHTDPDGNGMRINSKGTRGLASETASSIGSPTNVRGFAPIDQSPTSGAGVHEGMYAKPTAQILQGRVSSPRRKRASTTSQRQKTAQPVQTQVEKDQKGASTTSTAQAGAIASPNKKGEYSTGRRRIPKEQAEVLEQFFQANNLPSGEERKKIAEKTGLRERSVQIWFQNRRAKAKPKAQNSKDNVDLFHYFATRDANRLEKSNQRTHLVANLMQYQNSRPIINQRDWPPESSPHQMPWPDLAGDPPVPTAAPISYQGVGPVAESLPQGQIQQANGTWCPPGIPLDPLPEDGQHTNGQGSRGSVFSIGTPRGSGSPQRSPQDLGNTFAAQNVNASYAGYPESPLLFSPVPTTPLLGADQLAELSAGYPSELNCSPRSAVSASRPRHRHSKSMGIWDSGTPSALDGEPSANQIDGAVTGRPIAQLSRPPSSASLSSSFVQSPWFTSSRVSYDGPDEDVTLSRSKSAVALGAPLFGQDNGATKRRRSAYRYVGATPRLSASDLSRASSRVSPTASPPSSSAPVTPVDAVSAAQVRRRSSVGRARSYTQPNLRYAPTNDTPELRRGMKLQLEEQNNLATVVMVPDNVGVPTPNRSRSASTLYQCRPSSASTRRMSSASLSGSPQRRSSVQQLPAYPTMPEDFSFDAGRLRSQVHMVPEEEGYFQLRH